MHRKTDKKMSSSVFSCFLTTVQNVDVSLYSRFLFDEVMSLSFTESIVIGKCNSITLAIVHHDLLYIRAYIYYILNTAFNNEVS